METVANNCYNIFCTTTNKETNITICDMMIMLIILIIITVTVTIVSIVMCRRLTVSSF